ncbi:MAG: penicillin-binding protein 2 [Candidatus Pacebacteria bacterium]|nr:penicillin-binding protein 2 [Candidatus Paceibacterota bacterium]MBP9851742.1 penicillin-binding protein 2 [Candidatus Paceibacterota bacterium]
MALKNNVLNNSRPRITALSIFVGALALLIVARLFYIQVVHGKAFKEDADAQYTAPKSATVDRGTIFFSKKNGQQISAASQMSGFKMALVPDNITDAQAAYKAISEIVALDEAEFMQKAAKKGDPYEELNVHLSREMGDKVDSLKLAGVKLFQDKWRVYPANALASQTIGFVAYKGDDLSGRYGLERYYNKTLSRTANGQYVNFFAEIFSNIQSNFENDVDQGDVVTTIEPSVQAELELQLAAVQKKWGAEMAGGIIMDPKTGAIYAMGKTPGFDLNDFSQVENPREFSNPFVENVYEFGSVIKPLVMGAAVDAKVVTPETSYFDSGSVIVKDRTINNFDRKGRGAGTTMQDVLDQSLNTGMVFVQQKMGNDLFAKYMKNYLLGERTGIDLPNETSGLISNLTHDNDVELANAAFGQGIAITPVEAVRAFSSIANGGKMVTPHLASEIVLSSGLKKEMTIAEPVAVLKPETAATISVMMTHVVDKAMGGGIHKMEHYTIAGKTGTAQIAKESGGGYYSNKYLHSFFGFFPATNPKFLVFLFLRDPKGVDYASQTLIDPFFATAKFLLNYYNVPPDR